MTTQEIIQKIASNLPMLREKYHVNKLGIFGSAARGENTEQSDIDILVDFDTPIGFFDFIRLENFLSELLQKKVDLISEKAVKPIIRESILRDTVYV